MILGRRVSANPRKRQKKFGDQDVARARANGRIGGGRYKLFPTQTAEAIKMIRLGAKSHAEIAIFARAN
jgi:hypothetical protein